MSLQLKMVTLVTFSTFSTLGVACASVAHRTSDSDAARAAMYTCAVTAMRAGPLPVVSADSGHGRAVAQLRDDVAVGSPQIAGGAVGGLTRDDQESPYLIDVVIASVKNDRATGRPGLDVR